MDIDQFIKTVDLNESARAILYETEQLTGKPFDFTYDPSLPVQAVVKIARSSMSHHIIRYSGTNNSLLNHHIAHECGHILRYYATPKEYQIVPYSDEQTNRVAIADIEDYDREFIKSLPIDLRYQIIPVWINRLIHQVTTLPSDIYIEKWIFDNFSSLRNEQRKSLAQTHKEAVKALEPETRSHFPKVIIEKSIAMNYAFFKKKDEITGSAFFKKFNQPAFRIMGENLYSCIQDEDTGLVGDISLVNQWAGILQINDWFKWRDFESIPLGYENQEFGKLG